MEPIITTFSSLIVLDLSWGALKQMIPQIILMFAIISVGGWLYETVYCSVVEHGLRAEAFFLDQAVLSMALALYPCGLHSETLTTPFSYFF